MDAHALARQVLDWLEGWPAWLTIGVSGLIAAVEYVVPPVPHDGVIVAAGILAERGAVNPLVLLLVVTVGSMVGALAAWRIGLHAADHPRAQRFVARFVDPEALERMAVRFRRFGRLLLVANRFLPGLRTTLLFGAGMFRMGALEVAVTSAISALLWNGLLIGAGVLLGENLDDVLTYVEKYSLVAWIVVGVVVAFFVVRAFVRHRRKRRRARAHAQEPPHPGAEAAR